MIMQAEPSPSWFRIATLEGLRATSEGLRADSEAKRADQALQAAEAQQKDAQRIVQLLEEKFDRMLVELARYQMQFVTRTIICSMLQLALPKKNSPGGALFLEFVATHVLSDPKDPNCNTLTDASKQLYGDIQACAPFLSLKPKPETAWVAGVKNEYRFLNGGMHQLPILDSLGDGLACGGNSVDRMFMHAFIVATIQRICIASNIDILPAVYADVAVLSADLTEVVGRVQGGKFVQQPQPPSPSPRGGGRGGRGRGGGAAAARGGGGAAARGGGGGARAARGGETAREQLGLCLGCVLVHGVAVALIRVGAAALFEADCSGEYADCRRRTKGAYTRTCRGGAAALIW